MNKEEYLSLRNGLIKEVEGLIAEGKFEESEVKMQDVKDLDNKWEGITLANANLNALKDNAKVTEIENQSVTVKGEIVLENIQAPKVMDEKDVYTNAWAKMMMGKKLVDNEQEVFEKVNNDFQNAYTHTTSTTGTLIPETVAAGIWARAEEMYPLLADVKKYNIKGSLTLNKHTAIDAGDAAWYDEATAVADEQNTFAQLTLTGCELAKAITISWKLKAMSVQEFIPYIINELGERVGVVLGTAVAQGEGKPGESDSFKAQPLGIETALLAESNTPQVVTYDFDNTTTPVPLTYAKLTEAISKIHSSYLQGAAIYANNSTIWTQLANILDDNKRPIFIPDVTSGGVGRMFGMVVKPDAGITLNNIIIGNADKGYVMNTNEPMSVVSEDHAKARTTDYVAYTIVDGSVIDTKAFALIQETVAAG